MLPSDGKKHFENSVQLLEHVKKMPGGNTCLLAFSRGKDSIAAWLYLLEHGFKVIPYHYYPLPGVPFVENSLRDFERMFGTKIYTMPHPALFKQLYHNVLQTQDRAKILFKANLPFYDYEDAQAWVRLEANEPDALTAVGVRETDSMMRMRAVRKHGTLNYNRRSFFPIYDFKKQAVLDMIRKHNVKLPIDYKLWGRTWDGFNAQYLGPMKEMLPDDYAVVKHWFPMCEVVFKQREFSTMEYE